MSTLGATLERPVNLGAPPRTDFVPELRGPALGVPRIPGDAGIPPPEPPLRPSLADLLGLPEHTLTERTYEEKLANVTEFVSKRVAEMGYGFFDKSYGKSNREDFKQRLRVQKEEKLGIRAKFDRKLLLWKIGRSNITNPEEVLQFFEDHLPMYDYAYRNISPESLTRLIGKSGEENRAEAFLRIKMGISRLTELNIPPAVDNLNTPNFPEIIQELTEIPEDKFQEIYQEINKYTFLDDIFYLGGGDKISVDAEALIDIFKSGGLTPKQKELLDKQQFYMQLTGRTPSKTNHSTPNTFDFSMDISKAFDAASFSRIDEFLPYVVDFADWVITRSPEKSSDHPLLSETFLESLEYLRSRGSLPLMDVALKQGWILYKFYMRMNSYGTEREKLLDSLKTASEFGADQEKLTWVSAVKNILTGDADLDPSDVKRYERMYEQKEMIQNLSLILNELPSDNYPRNEDIVRISDDKVEINYSALAHRVWLVVNKGSEKGENRFAQTIQRIYENTETRVEQGFYNRNFTIRADDLGFLSYIAQQKADWDKIISGNHLKAEFIEKAVKNNITIPEDIIKSVLQDCIGPENFSPSFLMQYLADFNVFRVGEIIINMPEEAIATLSPDDQAFIRFIKPINVPLLQTILMMQKVRFNEFVVNGHFTSEFLGYAVLNHPNLLEEILMHVDIESFPPTEREFWRYFPKSNPIFHTLLLENRSRFSEFIVDEKPTPALYQAFALSNPTGFVNFANKEIFVSTFGEKMMQQLLESLPKRTDERRNAFTHNQYDRTTEFIQYLIQNGSKDFLLDQEHFKMLAPYVAQFGLAKNALLFHYFSQLYNLEKGKITELAEDVAASGIKSVEELRLKLTELSRLIYSDTPLTDLTTLSEFDKEMLKVVTGKAAHRFDGGRLSMEQIIANFQRDMTSGEIQPLPEGYKTKSLEVSKIHIEFDTKAIQSDFDTLSKEILGAIQNPNDISPLLSDLRNMLESKAAELERLVTTAQGGKQAYMLKEMDLMKEYFEKLADIPDADRLLVTLLDMKFSDTNQQKIINSIFRRIIFGKVFRKQFSPGFIQEIQTQLESGLNAGSIETIINIIDEMAKTHALNMSNSNQEGYWTDEAYLAITKSRRGKDLPHSFSPHIGKLKEAVKQFQIIKTGSDEVEVIPDRGFVGEMSGYLADVCYTAEYPLLKKWPNLVPYKFVRLNPQTGEPEFIGSVLVFSVAEAEGNPSLLVRAFDVPDETSIDIGQFIEGFLDSVVTPAAVATGKRQILVPGTLGAVSNYQMTMNHMRERYINGKSPISLAENFNFNNYDLTENCYVARVIQ